MNKLLASSVDPKQLSLAVKGALVALVPVIAVVIKAAGGEISNDDLQIVAQSIADIIAIVGTVASAVMLIAGVLRKVYNSFI